MSKVLVTGANGFVGRHMCNELIAHGYEVVGVGGPQLTDGTPTEHYSSVNLDLTNEQAVSTIDFKDIDSVVHLAGLAAVGPSFDEPLKYITANVGMEINLYEAAVRQGASPRFLVISSGSLYDPSADLPLSETSPVVPSSPYAVSKLCQEQMSQYYSKRGIEYIIARPFNHIGPGQGEGFLVPDLCKQIVSLEVVGGGEIKVGNLDAKRDYTDVRGIVRAYRLLIEKGKSGHVYNICSGTSRSGKEILDALLELAKTSITVSLDPTRLRPLDTPDIYGTHDKLTKDTDWQPEIALEQTLKDSLEDWRNRK